MKSDAVIRNGAAALDGIRIVDMTSVVFGPFGTSMLADVGADIIKVEPGAGDTFRYAGRAVTTPGMGACHMNLNKGKQSVVLDLKRPGDAARMRTLLATADVFIHNVRAEAMARLGFSYEAVRALRPDIIYVHCVGFGSDGPYGGLQAYDDVIQAASGATTLLPRVDGSGTPRYLPLTIADKAAGMYAAYGVLAAIVHAQRTGQGQFVEVPMFEAFTRFLLVEHLYGRTFDAPNGDVAYTRQIDTDRQPFPTSDGHISIVPYTDASIVALFEIMDAADLLEDPRFATTRDRVRNMTEVNAEIARRTPARSTAEWTRILTEANIPAMPVRDLADVLDDPHLRAIDFFERRQHPVEGGYYAMRPPIRFSAWSDPVLADAPAIGEQTEAVLATLEPESEH